MVQSSIRNFGGYAVFSENHTLYHLHEFHKAAVTPLRAMAKITHQVHTSPLSPLSFTPLGRTIAATSEMIERFTRRYNKPEWGITHTEIEGKSYKVTEKIVKQKTFCNLLKFERARDRHDPKLLIVAPLSGHYATLLRGTVEALLPHFQIYITDWVDAREVPVFDGTFDLDDYIDYVIDFIEILGPDVHTMAVCQPAVPLMAAVSVMSAENNPAVPLSMTLIGGPIDARKSPTEVNKLAHQRPIEWFESNVITRVPFNYPGFMRRVYPGFVQLSGFMQMNLERHIGEHVKLFQHLVIGDGESADAHKKFYNEYLAVMDLPAEFYLQTIKTVFKDYALPKGKMVSRGRKVDPGAITKTALLTLEGELDDISGAGQTQAAHKLCSNLPQSKQLDYVQKGVGHYGIFNGRKFREKVVPIIVGFTRKHSTRPDVKRTLRRVAAAKRRAATRRSARKK